MYVFFWLVIFTISKIDIIYSKQIEFEEETIFWARPSPLRGLVSKATCTHPFLHINLSTCWCCSLKSFVFILFFFIFLGIYLIIIFPHFVASLYLYKISYKIRKQTKKKTAKSKNCPFCQFLSRFLYFYDRFGQLFDIYILYIQWFQKLFADDVSW